MAWVVRYDGREIERHPKKETCLIVAVEKGLATRSRRGYHLHPDASVIEMPADPRKVGD